MKKLTYSVAGLIMAAIAPESHAAGPGVLKDKTLVVWVSPANLTQRGGSALTIDNDRGGFDGIVFGELAPGKWMAGSDGFARTEKVQAAFGAEVVETGTFVQMAMVWRGAQVTAFRNGVVYSQHAIGVPESFGGRSVVVIGRRHLTQNGSDHFGGAIDDARIYDRALSAEEIAVLKPNAESEMKPWAWWTFDDKEAKDRIGRFEITEITGGARVEDGKLVLDGVTGEFLGRTDKAPEPEERETPAMPLNPPTTWLSYHLAHPGPGGAIPADPNPAFYHKGRYHLHYIYNHKEGCAFAHVSSTDMVHWKWHPTTLTRKMTGHGMFSGTGFFTKDGRPAMIYHGEGSGRNQLAFAMDDQLEKWTRPVPIVPVDANGKEPSIRHWDPDCWLMGDTYYAIAGGSNPSLMKSDDLKQWLYLGELFHPDFPADLGVDKGEDTSCANTFRIGDKWMLLCISHGLGARYYLGDFKDGRFLPDHHALLNWARWDFFAPESLLTPDGRRVMWAWCTPWVNDMQKTSRTKNFDNLLNPAVFQQGIQSLPRELSLPKDGVLRIKPLRELEGLRHERMSAENFTVKGDSVRLLDGIKGDTMELEVVIEAPTAREYGINLLCDEKGGSGFVIGTGAGSRTLSVGYINPPFELKENEDLTLRIFIDKSMIEVFANDRQAAVAWHEYLPENLNVSLFSKGGDLTVKKVTGWKMKSTLKPASDD
jgi:sucrose-6-phosphate hydrolase SacC (GH32 family)